ncbi:U3 small nucleolar RNA-associated protein 14 A [Globodera pallida]|nr:U3 small nucleolar RNA-associated protein 14 A [Globodera pallida]
MASAEDERVNFDELLVSIKSTRQEKLDREQKRAATGQERRHGKTKKAVVQQKRRPVTEAEAELEAALEVQESERRNKKVLEAPLHRQARNRIESRLAYRQTKEELRPWDSIVEGLRVAEQLQFPHDERRDDPLRTLTAEERAKTFTPRTELELRMAEVLNGSKHAIRDGEQYSRAERELLKAMDVTEAQRKCAELRRMRALMSFQASKLKRQSKIKSKQFHRIRKRQQRRELVKEVEQLLVKDPEQADEKLKELEKDRAYERATLKHRGTNKWTKQRKNEAVALGDAANDDDESDKNSEAANFGEEEEKKHLVATESGNLDAALNPFYRSALENIRRERKTVSKQARAKAAKLVEHGVNFGGQLASVVAEVAKGPELDETEDEPTPFLDLNVRPILQVPQELADGADSDSGMLLHHTWGLKFFSAAFSSMNTGIKCIFEHVQHAFQAEAYADDDVLGEFQRRKERVETQEKPKAKQSKYLRGWGAWTGPGISEEAEQRRELKVFGQQPVLKARRRKDANRPGVIIREQRVSEGIQRLQPRDVPFPFTRIQDYEAYVRQPLGRDWNTPIAHQQLTKPSIVTKDGRIIRPLNKEVKKHKKMIADIIGENI